jgi:hypothetical protein
MVESATQVQTALAIPMDKILICLQIFELC